MGRKKGLKNKIKSTDETKHIVLYSGGLGSYFTTKRLLENGIKKENIVLLFTDTKIEDADLYRFLEESTAKLGIPLTNYSEGRDIWQVFRDVKYLGNSRLDPCSRVLKREMSRKFIKQFKPEECIIYLGFDWTEMNRYEKAQKAWLPYRIESPLCYKPYIDKEDMKLMIAEDGIKLPRLYEMGFQHNNCGGGCIKAGIGHFAHLLDTLPEVFKTWEDNEQTMRDYLKKDVSILRRTRDGVRSNFTLKQLREEREGLTPEELCEIGGCGCFQK
jgi:3'-phosphoadenosine 5'-phosphosulfate sulfotransferase (PAPS reductase)/FAD synthetase